ncbi:MAG: hypothetical protein JRD69_05910 [Deltaproteobacteria bacterium]|nr:hypothetical protein [Deltaproteobacteria bacterium]
MKKILIKSSDLVGVQAVYRNGELIYRDQQTEIEMEGNQVYETGKESVDNGQRT